jgi:hypothetical protein
MNEAARLYKGNFGWELTPYAKGTMAILNVPVQEGGAQQQYVMNTITGAWCKFTGMAANTWVVFKDNLYFGGNDGKVYQADTGAIDVATPITATGQGAYNFYDTPGRLKQWKLIQPLITTDTDNRPAIGLSTDFRDNALLGTPSSTTTAQAVYDTAVYDTDVYAIEGRAVADWTGISGVGQCASIHFRARTTVAAQAVYDTAIYNTDVYGVDTGDVVMRLNGFNVIHEQGGFL